jgi:hypothetical protein
MYLPFNEGRHCFAVNSASFLLTRMSLVELFCPMFQCLRILHVYIYIFVLNIFYSQLQRNGIEQQAMPIQALSFLHIQVIHSVKSI